MRKLISLCIGLLIIIQLQAQVAIKPGNIPPDASAMLDIQSTTRGLLIPRMTSVQRTAIATPANGLLVFDTDSASLFMFTGSWKKVGAVTSLKELISGTADGDVLRWNGTAWVVTPLTSLFQFFYRDKDGDGYGEKFQPVYSISAPEGFVNNSTDCDDNNATVNPSKVWYRDNDGDGFGASSTTTQACTQPSGYVSNNTDCNDNNVSIHPNGVETCNGIDDNCNGVIDLDATSGQTWYADVDRDGYGDPNNTQVSCTQPTGFVSTVGDCNDNNAMVSPGRAEICDNLDNDCDGQVDEGVKLTFYRDQDNDGFGNAMDATFACTPPSGYVTNTTDCDDANNTIYPGAPDAAGDLIDQNCDGIDGVEADGIFVATTGNNANAGTKTSPVASITTGLQKAQAAGKNQIYVANGTYNERVVLINGISIFGSYNPAAGWTRSGTAGSTITGAVFGTTYRGIDGSAITSGTTIDRIAVTTPNATQSGMSNYGLYCNNCPALQVTNSVITAGKGGNGSSGSSGGNGNAGGNGSSGQPGACNDAVPANGGAGGSGCQMGGSGGAGGQPGNGGSNGFFGGGGTVGGAGGAAGEPGLDGQQGANGIPGSNGANGGGGNGGAITTTSFVWIGTNGSNGVSGTPGHGGGGGGGGGGQNGLILRGTGNGGGGGGAGGCAGLPGTGGSAGGGSFGIFLSNSTGVILNGNTIHATGGGNGGFGGTGGTGGNGGFGFSGGSACDSEVGRGGSGGSGGRGGNGGHGGGGAGGISYGVYRYNTTVATSANSITAGAGGSGGSSSGNAGATGAAGPVN